MSINIGVPWLIAALEARFGTFGRRMGDLIVLFITALVFVAPSVGLAVVIKKWLWPESVSLLDQDTWEALAIIFVVMVMAGVVGLGIRYAWERIRLGIRNGEG